MINEVYKFNRKLLIAIITPIISVSIFLVVSLSLIYWPVSDDFSFYIQSRDLGIFGLIKYIYFNWGGRFFSYFLSSFFFTVFNFKYLYFLVTLLSIIFIFSSLLLSRFINQLIPKKQTQLYSFSIVFLSFFLSLTPILDETVYWAAGGLYILSTFFSLTWIYIFYIMVIKSARIKFPYLAIPIFLICSFLFGGFMENLSPSLIFLGLIFILISKKLNISRLNLVIAILALVFLIIGSVIMYLAPGNFIRAAGLANSFSFNISILVKNYSNTFLGFWVVFKRVFLFSFLGGISHSFYISNKNIEPNIIFKEYLKENRLNIFIFLSFFIASLISILPFALVPGGAASRASIYSCVYFFISIWGLTYYLFNGLFYFINKKFIKLSFIFTLISIIIFISFGSILIYKSMESFYLGIKLKSKIIEREQYLSNLTTIEKNSDLIIPAIEMKKPELLNFADITTNKDDWKNKGVADVYGLKSVAISDTDIEDFISEFYNSFLFKKPPDDELQFWKFALLTKRKTVQDLAKEVILENSVIKISDEDFLKKLYKVFFEREPDEGGYNDWLEEMKRNTSREKTIKVFLRSEEFKNKCDFYKITPY